MDILAIGVFDPAETPGGLDRYRVELGRALGARGHRVGHVCAVQGGRSLSPGAYRPGGAVATVARAATATRHLLHNGAGRQRWNLVASHFALTGAGAVCGTLPYRLPWVAHFHGPWAEEVAVEERGTPTLSTTVWSKLRSGLERAMYARAGAVITLSRAFAAVAAERYGVPRERLVTIPPGVDLERFRPGSRLTARRDLGLGAHETVLLCVRRLARRMGLETLIEAASTLPSGNWRLLIAGGGELHATLQGRIAALGLGERVRLLGRVPEANLPSLYRAADAFLLPSECLEGFGMVIPEALASGVPVVATPVGGVPEALEGLPGCLLPRGAGAEAIAGAMRAVIEGRARLPEPGAVRAYAERRFSWGRAASDVEDVYRGVCGA